MSRSASRPRVCAVPVPVPHLPTKFCSSAIDEIFGAKHRNFWKKIWKCQKNVIFEGFFGYFWLKKRASQLDLGFFFNPFQHFQHFQKKTQLVNKKMEENHLGNHSAAQPHPYPRENGGGPPTPPISFFWGRKQRHDFSVWLFTPRLYWLISCPKKILNWDARSNLGENGDKSQFSRKKINKSGEECAGGCVGIA